MSYGASVGWTSINFVDLQKEDTTFPSGPLTLTEATRVVSIFFASAVVGNLVLSHSVERFGSKKTIFALGLPQIVGYTLRIENSKKAPFFSFSGQLAADHFRTKSVLFVCLTCPSWMGFCRRTVFNCHICFRNMQ